MKMKMQSCLLLFLLTPLFISWKNNNPTPVLSKNKLELIQQKWQIKRHIFTNYDDTGADTNILDGSRHDYIDFRPDGKACIYYQGKADTLDYEITGEDQLSFGNTVYQITTINSSKFTLYLDEEQAGGAYNREWLELKK